MKKTSLIFIIFCMAACLIPLAGMAVRPTTESTENRKLSAFPSAVEEDGSLNRELFSEFDTYFNEHFAFRNELLYTDARIQGDVFGVSSVDSVIYGNDNWLYYTSTLENYLGENKLTAREQYNVVHNLEIAKTYLEDQGIDFVLAIPANKNTLYGSHMPYYDSYIVDPKHTLEEIEPLLKEKEIPYANLLQAFRDEKEELYLKRDSHWNGKGALLAYQKIMETLEYPYDDYATVYASRTKTENGDLNRMLYTFYGDKEFNYRYAIDEKYHYANDVNSVEDLWIVTENETGSGTVLMFRDSFGNTLIPLIANHFRFAWFTKEAPYGIEALVQEYHPQTVIFEKVERNIRDFITMPPIISAPEVNPDQTLYDDSEKTDTGITISSFEFDNRYYKISGEIRDIPLSDTQDIILKVNDTYYSAYHINENGFELYLKKNSADFPAEVSVMLEDGTSKRVIDTVTLQEGDILE